jgi:exodeoxyribonuclease V beta subunit
MAQSPPIVLKPGTNLIQASAGTGKTWSITTIVARQVAIEGLSVDQILVVSFTRAATAELRERVRSGLEELEQGLELLLSGDTPVEADRLELLLPELQAQEGGLERALQRLQIALNCFDQASIFTIHGFCRQTLMSSTLETDLSPDMELVQSLDPILSELVEDYWARELYDADPLRVQMLRVPGPPLGVSGSERQKITLELLKTLASELESNPDLQLVTSLEPALRDAADPETLLAAEWDAALEALRQAWDKEGTDAALWLATEAKAKRIVGSNYNSSRPKRLGKAMESWLDQSDLSRFRWLALPEWVPYFATRRIQPAQVDSTALAFPEVFAAADRVCRVNHAPVERFIWGLVQVLKTRLPELKERRAELSYTDLLHRIWKALENPQHRTLLQRRLRARYKVALIDEFQDTDPVQWQVFSGLFAEDIEPGGPMPILGLIGDPKQSIYAFRGADIDAYIQARKSAGAGVSTLGTNHRSDARLVDAVNQLFLPTGIFQHPEMAYERVLASPRYQDDRIRLQDGSMPALELQHVQLDDVEADGGLKEVKSQGRVMASGGWTQDRLPIWIASDVVRFLQSGRQIWNPETQTWRPVRPGDLAILMRGNQGVRSVYRALLDAGVPAVSFSEDSVLDTEVSLAVEQLLEALVKPRYEAHSRVLMTGPLIGMSAAKLDDLADSEWEKWFDTLVYWASQWAERGFMTAFRGLTRDLRIFEQLLSSLDGERMMTDLRHLSELLHTAERSMAAGPERLLRWFKEQRDQSDRRDTDAGKQRLESDSDAVQIMTIHKSKGLEFPVVWCPDLWKKVPVSPKPMLRFHSPAHQGQRILELSLNRKFAPRPTSQVLHWREEMQERMRLCYVALTRAKHHCRVVCGSIYGLEDSGLGNLLHTGSLNLSAPTRFEQVHSRIVSQQPDELEQDLQQIAQQSGGRIELRRFLPAEDIVYAPSAPNDPAPLRLAHFGTRSLDGSWGRGSYSGLTRGHKAPPAPDSPQAQGIDHSDEGTEAESQFEPVAETPSYLPLAGFPKGSRAGTFLHEVLEHHDFTEPLELEAQIEKYSRIHGFDRKWTPSLVEGLQAALDTPLGPVVNDLSLSQLRRDDPCERLDELDFDMPVLGGSQCNSPGSIGGPELAQALSAHAQDCPLLDPECLSRIASLEGQPLRGYLTGQIDLVFRVHGTERWYLADYKSNWLGDPRTKQCDPSHYSAERLIGAMNKGLYVLQYHLYTLALHRLLRWRISDYDYERHMGGAFYLFIRGMTGDHPTGSDGAQKGVFFDRPPLARIDALDHLLAGGLS